MKRGLYEREKRRVLEACQDYGLCIFFDRKSYINGGIENEKFVSWGKEDEERFIRFSKLGYKWKRLPGFAYHLYHTRGISSSNLNPLLDNNTEECRRIESLTPDELRGEIKTWPWLKGVS